MNNLEFSKAIQRATNPLPGSQPYSFNYQLAVKQQYNGKTLEYSLLDKFPLIPIEEWENKVISKNLLLNDKPTTLATVLKAGQIIRHSSTINQEPTVSTAIELIYEDDDFLVINKPSPLPVHPSGRFNKNTLTQILSLAFPKLELKLLHRIDANTTGLVLFGKNKIIAQQVLKMFQNNLIKKEYLALVEGIVKEDSFTLNQPISKDISISGSRNTALSGHRTETSFLTLRRNTNSSLISVTPYSGRTNQIRIHLASIGHPIVGDRGYKDKNYFMNNPLTYDQDCLFLHAHQLSFTINGKDYNFTAPTLKKELHS